MLHVYLLRHGQTAWNADGNRYCGRTDLPLTETGVFQARQAARQLSAIRLDAAYASPLQRALDTATIIAGDRVTPDDRLIEIDFGSWEGRTKEAFIREDSTSWDDWMRDPFHARAGGNGETGREVIARLDDFYGWLLSRHPEGHVLVVGHNGVNRLYLCHKLGMPLKNYRRFFLDNATVTMFTLNSDAELTLKYLNSKL
jgi:alpha-ribazole phosphatase/probable phosphoglycerate mutase